MPDQSFPPIDLTAAAPTSTGDALDRLPARSPDPVPDSRETPAVFDALTALEAELATTVPVPTVTIPVEHRPGWSVTYRTNIAWAEIQQWRKQATHNNRVDRTYVSRLILANTCLGFVKDKAPAVTPAGDPITFGFIAKQRDTSVADAVLYWLHTDGAVEGTSDVVFVKSGYGQPPMVDEGDGEDPTRG